MEPDGRTLREKRAHSETLASWADIIRIFGRGARWTEMAGDYADGRSWSRMAGAGGTLASWEDVGPESGENRQIIGD